MGVTANCRHYCYYGYCCCHCYCYDGDDDGCYYYSTLQPLLYVYSYFS